MHVLIGIALKSLLIAGLTLGLLAADEAALGRRAFVGRAYRPPRASIIMAFAPLVLPSWNVEAPALFGQAPPRSGRRAIVRPRRPRSAKPSQSAATPRRRRSSTSFDQPDRRGDRRFTPSRPRSCCSSPSSRWPG